jgi:hypothetical protein
VRIPPRTSQFTSLFSSDARRGISLARRTSRRRHLVSGLKRLAFRYETPQNCSVRLCLRNHAIKQTELPGTTPKKLRVI